MDIEIRIKNKAVSVCLLDSGNVFDSVAIEEEHRLSEDLLPAINNLLIKNGLDVINIGKMTLESDMGENFTTQRIALTVINAFNWGRTVDN